MEVKHVNVIGFKVSADDVVIEFGTFFPEDGRVKPDSRDFHTRIAISGQVLGALQHGLVQVVAAMEQAKKTNQGPTFFTPEVKNA